MKLLTKNTDYAIRTLICVAKAKKIIGSSEIYLADAIPLKYLRNVILPTLKVHNIIETKKGINGGVKLKLQPSQISVAKLMRIFQGEIKISDCMFRKKLCSNRANCVLRKRIGLIEQEVIDKFNHISIQTLLNDLGGK